MKKIVLCLFCACSFLFVFAQQGEESKLTSAVNDFYKYLVDPDKNKLEAMTDDQLTYGHSSGKLESKAQLIESFVSGSADFIKADIGGIKIQFSGKTAIVRHSLIGKAVSDGVPGDLKLGVLMVWQKTKKDWKLLARQAYKI